MINDFYVEWLKKELGQVKDDLSQTFPILKEYSLVVSDEQNFVKLDQKQPKTIFVVTKKSSSTIVYSTIVQPYQIMILAEQDTHKITQCIFQEFANKWNFVTLDVDATTKLKQQYSEPIIMQNFVELGPGYRTVFYISASLFILKNIMDIKEIYYGTEKIEFITAGLNYISQGDTQQLPTQEIARTIKTTAALSFSLVVPCTLTKLTKDVMKIVNEDMLGNTDFRFKIVWTGGISFDIKTFRLTQMNIQTAPNGIPSLNLGFTM